MDHNKRNARIRRVHKAFKKAFPTAEFDTRPWEGFRLRTGRNWLPVMVGRLGDITIGTDSTGRVTRQTILGAVAAARHYDAVK